MGTCTVIARGKDMARDQLHCFIPIRDALKLADNLWHDKCYAFVRVYAETANGTILTLVYQP